MVYAALEPTNGELVYANGGHLPPLIRRASGAWEMLTPTGVVVGVVGEAKYAERRTRLDRGDLMLLYSDGVTEAQSPSGEFFDTENVKAAVDARIDRPVPDIVSGLVGDVGRFSPGNPGDDQTIVALRRG